MLVLGYKEETMKKILICIIMLFFAMPSFAEYDPIETSNPEWVQISKKVWADNNMAKFVEGTDYRQALITVKILNDNNIPRIKNRKVWYKQGLYVLDCWENKIIVSKLFYYDLNAQLLTSIKSNAKMPIENYEKDIVNYMCVNKKNQILQLEEKLQQQYNTQNEIYYKQREINALEDIRDNLDMLRIGL